MATIAANKPINPVVLITGGAGFLGSALIREQAVIDWNRTGAFPKTC